MQVRVHNPDNLFQGTFLHRNRQTFLEYGYSHRKEKYVHIVAASGGLFLFLHLHLVNVADFALDGLDGLGLVYRLNVHGNRHFSVHLQQLGKELVRELGGHDLHIRGRSPCGAHAEQAALAEVKAGEGDKILCPHSGLGYHIPCKAERLHAAGVELAVKDLQPFQPREGPGLYPPAF